MTEIQQQTQTFNGFQVCVSDVHEKDLYKCNVLQTVMNAGTG